MTSIAPRPSAGTPLELRCAGVPLQALFMAGFGTQGVLRLIHPHDTGDIVLGVFSISVVVAGLVLVLFVRRRAKALGCVVRLDGEGVTVKGAPTVPWADLSAVHWGKAPGKRYAALAPLVFVPRPGVELPLVPGPLFRARSEGRTARNLKRYGSPLVFAPVQLRTTGPEVLAAVQRLSPDTPLTSA
ncbi:hypothetical protein ACFXDJ_30590 [Streptomyces sp. NPDC059443]|uniref:hypothetical protein n=1 Tax=unclassified Streptomyces TaxID=2593676 RepID=UPI00369554B4